MMNICMDMKQQIVGWVRQIDDLNAEIAGHWSMIQKSVAAGDLENAIPLLRAYFSLKTRLVGVESSLEGMLHGYFSE